MYQPPLAQLKFGCMEEYGEESEEGEYDQYGEVDYDSEAGLRWLREATWTVGSTNHKSCV